MSQTDIVVVGAGQAGSHAAMALRNAGHHGSITLVGEENEPPYERPPLSKEMLTSTEMPAPAHFHPLERYGEKKIDLICGVRVSAIDPGRRVVSLDDGRALPFGKLLIATGSRPRRMEVPGNERLIYLRNLEDARVLRQRLNPGIRVVCIGAGVIGLEIASAAIARNCAVTVIEAGQGAMARSVSTEVGKWLCTRHEEHGVRFLFGSSIAEIREEGVVTAGGHFVPADVVVAGIGTERDTALAASAEIAVANGILVDEFGETTIAGIYAAGDVAAFWSARHGRHVRLENWQHAQDHGSAVGRSMAGQRVPYDPVPWFWTDQHGINLQMAGSAEGAASAVVRGSTADGAFSVWTFDTADLVIGVTGINAPRDVRAGRMLIRSRKYVDPALIADVSYPVQTLVKAVA
ncbi:NAD(P)/FAD-dependent oxidoreductase [Pseudochelatococcus sp. B33]